MIRDHDVPKSSGVSAADFVAATQFLTHEAELLDNNLLDEWLECLAHDLRYFMPVRTTMLRAQLTDSVSKTVGHFDDDYAAIALRVKRIQLPSAWSEDPPSRTRRFVTNVRASNRDAADEIAVASYLLLLRSRWDNPNYEIISAERRDVLRRTDRGLQLASREIIGDQVTLGTTNLSIFL